MKDQPDKVFSAVVWYRIREGILVVLGSPLWWMVIKVALLNDSDEEGTRIMLWLVYNVQKRLVDAHFIIGLIHTHFYFVVVWIIHGLDVSLVAYHPASLNLFVDMLNRIPCLENGFTKNFSDAQGLRCP
jgi:hypothetical protein